MTVSGTVLAAGLAFIKEASAGNVNRLLTAGTIDFGNSNATITSADLSSSGGSIVCIETNLKGTGAITLAANGLPTYVSPTNSTGMLVLRGDNRGLTGGLTITSGGVSFQSVNAAGAVGSTVTLNGGGMVASYFLGSGTTNPTGSPSNYSFDRNIAIGVSGGWMRSWGTCNMLVTGILSGTGTLTFTDAGATSFNNTGNTFAGKMIVDTNATLGFSAGAVGGALPGFVSDAITLRSGATLMNMALYAFQPLTVHSAGVLVLDANRGITLAGDATIRVTMFNPAGGTSSMTIRSVISGGGKLTKSDYGVLTLGGINTYTGATTILTNSTTSAITVGVLNNVTGNYDGSIRINGANGITLQSNTTLSVYGSLVATGTSDTIANSGTVIFAGGGSIDLAGLFNTWNGKASGTYTLVTGSGTKTGVANVVGYDTGTWSNVVYNNGQLIFTAVPEPHVYGLLGAGVLALFTAVRRRHRHRISDEHRSGPFG